MGRLCVLFLYAYLGVAFSDSVAHRPHSLTSLQRLRGFESNRLDLSLPFIYLFTAAAEARA